MGVLVGKTTLRQVPAGGGASARDGTRSRASQFDRRRAIDQRPMSRQPASSPVLQAQIGDHYEMLLLREGGFFCSMCYISGTDAGEPQKKSERTPLIAARDTSYYVHSHTNQSQFREMFHLLTTSHQDWLVRLDRIDLRGVSLAQKLLLEFQRCTYYYTS